MVTAGGPYYVPLEDMDFAEARRDFQERLAGDARRRPLRRGTVRPPGTLLFIGGTGGRQHRRRLGAHLRDDRGAPAAHREPGARAGADPGRTSSPPASSTRPCRRRSSATSSTPAATELRATLPIRRVVGPADVAALAVHIMVNTALTGATYDVDGGQQLVDRSSA